MSPKSAYRLLETRSEQFHVSRLTDTLGALNPCVQGFLGRAREFFLLRTGDSARSLSLSVQALDEQRQQQAASLAYFEVFWLGAVLSAALLLLVFLMKRSVAEKGEHIGAE
jgi:DHA2 family multidrug resistance protein